VETSARENVGDRGAIYRGRAGHWRGTWGKQWSPSVVAFNSCVTGVEENELVPFTRGEMEGRLRGAQSYAKEAAGGTRGGGYTGRRWRRGWFREEDDGLVGIRGLHG
jgi:hypothetical protein